jgi:proline iminopeptidase
MVPTSDGARLAAYISGRADGLPMLLCHGGPGLWDYLAPVAELLPEFSVHRFDQRGCGGSSGPADYSVARAIEDIEDLRCYLGYQRWCVFGHSWGATLALAYAWTHADQVESLVYCAGVGPGNDWKAPYREAERARLTSEQIERQQELEQADRGPAEEIEYLTLCWCTDYADREAGLSWAHHDAANAPAGVNFIANRRLSAEVGTWSVADVATRCQQITAPTLVIHGDADPRPLWNARRIAEMITDAEFRAIPGAGHMLWRENAQDFAAVLRGFLRHPGAPTVPC